MNINNFKINKDDDVLVQSKKLVNFIEKKTQEENIKKIIETLSVSTNIPHADIEFDFKKNLTANHDFRSGKFKRILHISNIFLSSIHYLITLLFVLFFSKSNRRDKEKVEIIFDGILSPGEEKRLHPLKKKFNKYKIISSNKFEKHDNYIVFRKNIGCLREYIFPKIFNFTVICFFKTLKFSLKEKTNFFPTVLFILKKIIKYESIFQKFESNFLLEERHYTTSAIKNYLFKKYGGKLNCCLQRIIIHLGTTGFYINADIFFSLGKKTSDILQITGSRIKKIIPIGSYVYDAMWINQKKIDTPKYDIIYLGGNSLDFFSTDSKYLTNYYEQLSWLKNLGEDFPKLSIAIKHHENIKHIDKKELKIIKNSRVERITSSIPGKTNASYGFAINASIRLTWCSTMGYELIGHGYPCYFLDPKLENKSFLHDYQYNKIWRIDSYSKLKNKIKNITENKKKDVVMDNENFCLISKNVSEKIVASLKNNLLNLS